MHIKQHPRSIKQSLFVLGLFVIVFLILGAGNLPTAHAQGVATPEPNKFYTIETIRLSNGTSLDEMIINGPPVPPPGFEIERQIVSLPVPDSVGTGVLTVPAYSWVYGCSAVSGAMIAGYYDQNGWSDLYTGPIIGIYEYVDLTAPDTQIDSSPADPSNSAEVTFTFSSANATASFECSLDDGDFAACASPKNYTGLADELHTFTVRAKDLAGNTDATPASFTWTIHTTVGIRYAKSAVSGAENCSSWANACTLQTALTGAISGDEIWVAAGTHKPTTGTDRAATFQLKDGVAVYGGFIGAETVRDQRDFDANETILSGDLLGNDNDHVAHDEPTRAENSYHVVVGSGTDTTAVLDGFTVSGGNADVYPSDIYPVPCDLGCGGGMYNISGSPTLRNVVFSANAVYDGGGMYNWGSSPVLTNVTFSNNSADNQGGGIINLNNSNPTLINVNIIANSAYEGGGMLNYLSSPTLTNVIFSGNSVSLDGGGLWNSEGNPTLTNITFSDNSASSMGGGMFNVYSGPALLNVTFSANSANEGGGMHNLESNPTLTNVTMNGNYGGGLYGIDSNPTLKNVIIANSLGGGDCGPENEPEEEGSLNAASSHNLIQDEFNACGLIDGVNGNIIGSDPLLDVLADNGSFTQTHALLPGSPAIDAGTNIGCPAIDQRGVARPQGSSCDIGAYEFVDLLAPDTQIDSSPDDPSNVTAATFTFSSADATASFECSLDGSAFTACASPKNYTGLADELHTFTVRAKDPAGNTDATPATFTWTIQTTVGIRYAKPAVSGAENCSSWANACTLQTALTGAISGDEIWVAAGTHKPTTGTDRAATFQLEDGVAVYGGFIGTETVRDQRDFDANETILSGDLSENDNSNMNFDEPTRADNSYHVVTGATDAILNGFTITAGNANGGSGCPGTDCGGGMINNAGNPTLMNVAFSGNSAQAGGGMANNSSSPALAEVTFSDNSAVLGGGMINNFSSPILMNVTFSQNLAESGGGVFNFANSNPVLTNVTFSDNSANTGGGMFNGGGLFSPGSAPVLTNVTFSSNSANEGGGIYNMEDSSPAIRNSILWGNTADLGAQIEDETGSTPVVSDSIVQNGYAGGTNIITTDPLLGALGNYGSYTHTIPLLAGSSAIDTGNDTLCPATDQRGVARSQGSACDIGAYEFVDSTLPTVDTFIATSPSTSLNISITAFTASDNVVVSGYLITESNTPPAVGDVGWSISAPTNFTVASDGIYDLYPWAKDASGNISPVFGSPASVTVDTTSPAVTMTSLASNPTNASPIPVIVQFSEAVTGFIAADIVPGNGTLSNFTALDGDTYIFDLIPAANGSVTADIAAGVATDLAGNANTFALHFSRNYDATAPAVLSSVRANANPTNLASVDFTVSFSESVTGVDVTDFTLTTSGVSGAAVSGVSGSGSVYMVSVNTGTGNGTIRLNVVNDNSIMDATLNPLATGFTGGETYDVSKAATVATFKDVPLTYWASSFVESLYSAGITGGCATTPDLLYCPETSVTRAQMAVFLLKSMHGAGFTPPLVGDSTGFGDVATSHWAAAWIKQLAAEGITGGCGNDNYCPENPVTRAQMAVFLLKAKNGSGYTPPLIGDGSGFTDVPNNYWAAVWIKQLAADGITGGCGAGVYCPESPVTRAQMAVFLVRAFNLP